MDTYLKCEKQQVNLLLVDDHQENLLALEAVLSSPDYHLIKVTSGEEALKWVLKEKFAVILLDVQMPGIDGFETARLIKAREKSKDIPIIFITAISQAAEHVLQGYGVGGIDYIFKPFEPETLIRKIEGFVQLHRTMEKVKEQSELLQQRTSELERVNQELEETTIALRKTEALARVISEVSIDTILTLDQQGYILNTNPAVQTMFGYVEEEALGEHISILIPNFVFYQEDLLKYEQTSKNEHKHCGVVESLARKNSGETFPVEVSVGQARVCGQHVVICSLRDITERKQIERERLGQYEKLEKLVHNRTHQIRLANEKLKLSEKRFRKTFEGSPNLMSIHSLRDGRYIDVNQSWEKYTGYLRDEVKDKRLELFKGNVSLYGELPVQNVRVTYKTKLGKIRQGLLSTEILELEGEKSLLSVITDITEQLKLEQEMARLDRLNLVGEMAAGIAHEIRNPMTTVRGFLQMMSVHPDHYVKNEFFELMIEELDRANSIITEFLTLSKDQAIKLRRNNLNNLLETLFPLIQADAFNCKNDVRLELQQIPDLEYDEREIRQMILNLARNGIEAMGQGGTLTLRTYRLSDEVILEVEDEGNGINPEILQRLGTPFFTTKEKGTGLGLAVCYGIAEKHKARISINTGPKGTTFFVRFSHVIKPVLQQESCS